MNPPVQAKYPGQPSDKQHKNTKRHELVDGDDGVVAEGGPRQVRSVPQKDGHVEKHVNRRLQRVVQRFKTEPIVPGECISSNEAGQNVVCADQPACAEHKQRQGYGRDQEALPVDIIALHGPTEQLLAQPSHNGAVNDAQDDGVSPGICKPKAHGISGPSRGSTGADKLDQIQGKEEEGIAQPVIRARFGDNEVLQVLGNVVVRKLAFDDDSRQYGIRRRDTGAHGEGMQEARRPGKCPDQEARREPHQRHARAEQQHERLALSPEIFARQLDARNDQLDAEHQPREVERDDAQPRVDTVGIADGRRAASSIAIRPNEVGPMRAEGNANEEGDDCSAARLAGDATVDKAARVVCMRSKAVCHPDKAVSLVRAVRRCLFQQDKVHRKGKGKGKKLTSFR